MRSYRDRIKGHLTVSFCAVPATRTDHSGTRHGWIVEMVVRQSTTVRHTPISVLFDTEDAAKREAQRFLEIERNVR